MIMVHFKYVAVNSDVMVVRIWFTHSGASGAVVWYAVFECFHCSSISSIIYWTGIRLFFKLVLLHSVAEFLDACVTIVSLECG
jgi:hypothetical protein